MLKICITGLLGVMCSSAALAQCEAWPICLQQTDQPLNSTVNAAISWDSDGPGPQPPLLVMGGQFVTAGAVTVNQVVAWGGQQWIPFASGLFPVVTSLATYNGHLLAATDFGGWRLFEWDGQGWATLAEPSGAVLTMTNYQGRLIVGGSVVSIGGVSVSRIASFDGTSWTPLGSGLGGLVLALCVFEGDLIAAGSFPTAGGVPASNIARWDGQNWVPLGAGLSATVRALAVHQGQLFAGGDFDASGSTSCRRIARWNGVAWHPLAQGLDDSVYALSSYHDQLIAGGKFRRRVGDTFGSPLYDRVARWDGASWQRMGAGLLGECRALAEHNGELIIAGTFSTANGTPSRHWARWTFVPCCGSSDFNNDGDYGTDQDIEAFFACLGGNCCSSCGSADFNGDGDFGTDQDIEAFFRVLGGSSC